MNRNQRLVAVFQDTLQHLAALSQKSVTSVINEDYPLRPLAPGPGTRIYVKDTDSLTGAFEGALVMNFASGWVPGGGVVRGCSAQEENICQRSSLYPELISQAAQEFYAVNHRYPNVGADIMLLTRGVTVLKDADFEYLPQPFVIDVLTVAAPRLTDGLPLPIDRLNQVLARRVNAVIKACAHHGYRRLVLGAWGCGAYRNDPVVVSRLFHDSLQTYGGYFDEVIFAIPGGRNYEVFADVFGTDDTPRD